MDNIDYYSTEDCLNTFSPSFQENDLKENSSASTRTSFDELESLDTTQSSTWTLGPPLGLISTLLDF